MLVWLRVAGNHRKRASTILPTSSRTRSTATPSAPGIASIFVVTVALWMAFFDAIIPGGSGDLSWRVVAGLLLGFAGTALLVGATPAQILHADLRGPIALTLASASWSLGSVYAKRHPTEASPYVGAALQMIVGGAAGASE